jgi:hypothetical protein
MIKRTIEKMTVYAIQCPSCHDTIYSRARHDCHPCSCGAVSIDGGLAYTRVLWDEKKLGGSGLPPIDRVVIGATPKQLWEDWNSGKDKFGWIKEAKIKAKRPRRGCRKPS